METSQLTKKLIILCDGTWCGRETGTHTNISLVAEAIGIEVKDSIVDAKPREFVNAERRITACYFPGIGLGGTFLEYLLQGSTANDIGKECRKVYEYIVRSFDDQTEIWMFGLSRGSYTVRCVAGMINNCGIIKERADSDETQTLANEVYAIYRSPFEDDKPDATRTDEFRRKVSWPVISPVKVMVILDTVGSLGIPKLDAGVGFTWPEFYDQNISGVVQKVYHACSIHDRLWAFQPCRARRPDGFEHHGNQDYYIQEKWFPGCHYDLGRQKFKFFREGVNAVEKFVFLLPSRLTKPVLPNAVCADLVLHWMYKAMEENDPHNQVFKRTARDELSFLEVAMKRPQDIGSGDIYSNMQDHSPTGAIGHALRNITGAATALLNTITPSMQLGSAIQDFLGVKVILNVLLATRDRRIQDTKAEVVDLHEPLALLGGVSVHEKGQLARYKSSTVAKWSLIRKIMEE